MNGRFQAVSAALVAAVVEDPALVRHALSLTPASAMDDLPLSAEARAVLEGLPAERRAAMLASPRLARMREMVAKQHAGAAEAVKRAGLGREDLREPLDIEKAWHALHFILAGTLDVPTAAPGDAVLGGTPVGEDLGYGPARVMTPAQVRSTSDALAQLSDAEADARYRPAALSAAGVYPGSWEDPEAKRWILDAFRSVRGYFGEAAARGDGLLLLLT